MVKIRRAYEVLALGLFLFFLVITDLRYLKGWPVSLFLEATPLVAVSTALTTHTIYRNLVWGLVVIAVTMMLGRVWCNWMCPFGIMHHFFGWIGNRRNTKQLIEVNRYKKIYAIKYYILAAMLAMASLWIIPTLWYAPGRIAHAYRLPEPSHRAGFQIREMVAVLLIVAHELSSWRLPVEARASPWRDSRSSWASIHRGRKFAHTGFSISGDHGRMLAVVGVALLLGLTRAGVSRTFDAVGTGFAQAAEENKAKKSTLQIGLLDPIALTVRSMTTSVLPTVHMASESIYTEPREYWQAWVVGLIFIGFLVANWWIPRFFCRVASARSGRLLGIFSRFPLWRIDRDPGPMHRLRPLHQELRRRILTRTRTCRKSECFVCLNCIEDCPHDALTLPLPPEEGERGDVSRKIGRRQLMMAGVFGLLFFPMAGALGRGPERTSTAAVIRPPGSVAEDEFLRRCIKCDQCIRVCPDERPPAVDVRGGAGGLWTPIMISKMGWCELNCTLCSQVCPTGAIREISIAEKLGVGPFEAKGPIKTGTAFYNQGRCLPWAMDTSCVSLREVCPVSPKAIFTRNVEVTTAGARPFNSSAPFMLTPSVVSAAGSAARMPRPGLNPAVYVAAIGETQDKSRSLLLSLVEDNAGLDIVVTGRAWGRGKRRRTAAIGARASRQRLFFRNPQASSLHPYPGARR